MRIRLCFLVALATLTGCVGVSEKVYLRNDAGETVTCQRVATAGLLNVIIGQDPKDKAQEEFEYCIARAEERGYKQIPAP